jgi:hypothetical protein
MPVAMTTKSRYLIQVHLRVKEDLAQGDEAEMLAAHLADALETFSLDACSVSLGETYREIDP